MKLEPMTAGEAIKRATGATTAEMVKFSPPELIQFGRECARELGAVLWLDMPAHDAQGGGGGA